MRFGFGNDNSAICNYLTYVNIKIAYIRRIIITDSDINSFANSDDKDALTDAYVLIGVLSDDYFKSSKTVFNTDVLPTLTTLSDKTRFLLL